MAPWFSRSAIIGLALALAACGSNPPATPDAGALDPVSFFLGRTHGDAELHKLFASPVQVKVDGVGRKQGGKLVLDQTTRQGRQAPKARRWVMHKVAPNLYSGTLTDATGPVDIMVEGPSASIRYNMTGGFSVRQQLDLQPDGKTIFNKLYVTKFGVRVATLRETIRKLD